MNSTKKKHPHGHVSGHLGAKRKKDKSPKQPRASKLHILACHGVGRVDLGFMYAPLLSTLKIGFEALGHEFSVCGAASQANGSALLHEPAPFSMLVFIGDKGPQAVPWLQLRSRGVHTVMYNTERTRPGFPCASNDGRNWLDPGDGTPILVDELWDYSQCNIAACAEAAPTLRQRYVPPGFVPSTPVRQGDHLGPLVFVGPTSGGSYAGRAPCWRSLTAALGKSRLARFQNAFDEEHLGAALQRSGAFLNLHKRCDSPAQPLESFRVSRLLSSSALVVSERACAADEREFEGLADFAAAARLADAYLGLANKSRAEREAIAGERAARFATRFAPEALLRRAGVDALLRDLIARTSSKT